MRNDRTALQELAAFVEVARAASFSRAARQLGLSTATMSRSVAALESDCGIKLFNRSTRRLVLTRAGAELLQRCGPVVDEVRLARDALRERAGRIAGLLRVSMPADFGAMIVPTLLVGFAERYPEVRLHLDLSPHRHDLTRDEFDVVIRLGTIKGEALVSRRIGWLEQALFAAPRYLERLGRPEHPSQLASHECIFIGSSGKLDATWHLSSAKTGSAKVVVSGRFSVNNQSLMGALARAGAGIGLLEVSLIKTSVESGQLIRVLPAWSAPRIPVHAVTTSRLQGVVVKTFVDALRDFLQATRA